MPIFHVTTQLGRMDSFFLEADNENDIVSLLENVSEADIINIKKIVYSKNYKIATNDSISIIPNYEDSVYKWSWICFSNSYTKQIDLYNVKPTTTRKDIEDFLKTQSIRDEYIVGFYDDFKTEFKDIALYDDNLYQVVYKLNSRTYTENFYSNNIQALINFFDKKIAGELVEVREYKLTNLSTKLDDGNYYKRVSLSFLDEKKQFKTFIPNIKKNKSIDELKSFIVNYLRFNNKRIQDDKINLYLKS